MDWLEEKIEKTARHIRNLSFRKAMIAYILVLALIVFIFSYLTMVLCWQWEIAEWGKHEREDFVEVIYKKGPLWGPDYTFEAGTDSRKLLLLDFVRVWCPYFYAFAGMVVTIFIFYQKRLASPLRILEESVAQIRGNNLDFHVHYDSEDELGSLCDSVENMRMELVRGKEEMWMMVERQKELNAAFAHDLRTPLTVLKGYTDFLARYLPEGKISEAKMADTLALMSEHLKRLENYSRTMKGIRSIDEVPFSPEVIRLGSLGKKIQEVVFALGQTGDIGIFYRGCALKDCSEDGAAGERFGSEVIWKDNGEIRVQADENIIMEVLENLLSNAIRYAGTQIEVITEYDMQKMEFLMVVRDDGKGFSEEQLVKALKPYYKENDSVEMDEHFGIGLHICREFCKKHGGTLDVANSIRGGAVATASFFVAVFGENSIYP